MERHHLKWWIKKALTPPFSLVSILENGFSTFHSLTQKKLHIIKYGVTAIV
jgi:hypothetical protein